MLSGRNEQKDAALDLLLHRCTIINIRGESFRTKEKRQATRSTLNALLDTAAITSQTNLAAKEETTVT